MAKHDMTAAEIQDLLGLEPHPTCGFVRVTYVAGDEIAPGGLLHRSTVDDQRARRCTSR